MWGLSSEALQVLGVFFGSLIMWIGVSIDWPSMITLLALGFIPTFGFSKTFAGAFGNTTVAFLLFTFRKKIEFRLIKNLGVVYLIFLIIDIVCVVSLTYLNIIISPRTILVQPILISITTCLLFLRAVLCIVVKKFENYWLYKQSLLKKLNQEIVLDKQLPKLSKKIKKDSFLQELKGILQSLYFKRLFIYLISYQVYMVCLKYKDKKTCRDYKTALIQFSYMYLLKE